MTDTFPKDRELSEPERLRIFEADKPLIREIKKAAGLEEDEVKRRAVHLGAQALAEMLHIELPKKKAA